MRATPATDNPKRPAKAGSPHPRKDPPVVAAVEERESLATLLQLCGTYMPPDDIELIRAAYRIADDAHRGVFRKSGEPYIEHPIAVACILAELAMDAQGIAAALLHDTVEDTKVTLEEVDARFGAVIAGIVDGVTKFAAVEELKPEGTGTAMADVGAQRERKARQQSETVRKLFLAMSNDPRVVILKLADRLHNMRTMDAMTPAQRETKSRETRELYVPLASRIGLYLIKNELEDLAFSYLEPEAFEHTVQRLREEAARRHEWAQRMRSRIEDELASHGIVAAVNWRLKRPYRAYQEARESGMPLSQLHDLIALRVLVNTPSECYAAMGVIHQLWHPYDNRIHDYIQYPKVNGYQSLHTAVFALDAQLAQIHIRTHEMHRASQHGVTFHWLEYAARYGKLDSQTSNNLLRTEDTLDWAMQLSAWHRELGLSASAFVSAIQGDLLNEQIFVFSPKGDIFELPAGATVLDFAYKIHTKIGDHVTGARVQTNDANGLLVTHLAGLDYELHTGDVVNVFSDPNAEPKPEWRQIARSHYASEKIARTLRQQERARAQAAEVAIAESQQEPSRVLTHPSGKPAVIELCRRCYPYFGDSITALPRGSNILTIHRTCCKALHSTLARRKTSDSHLPPPQPIHWTDLPPMTMGVVLTIDGQDHKGLMYELSKCALELGLNVAATTAYANQDRHKAAVAMTLDIPPDVRLDHVVRQFQRLPGIVNVRRDTHRGCDEA